MNREPVRIVQVQYANGSDLAFDLNSAIAILMYNTDFKPTFEDHLPAYQDLEKTPIPTLHYVVRQNVIEGREDMSLVIHDVVERPNAEDSSTVSTYGVCSFHDPDCIVSAAMMDLADACRNGEIRDTSSVEARIAASIRSALTDADQFPVEVVENLQDWRVGASIIPDLDAIQGMGSTKIEDMIVEAGLARFRTAALELGVVLTPKVSQSPTI